MTGPDDERSRGVRGNNRILLTVLVAFVLAVSANSFFHIGQEAGSDPVPAATPVRP